MKMLDTEAARAAQRIIESSESIVIGPPVKKWSDVENLITKALGVLQENGVYAGMLFLYSRSNETDKKVAEMTRKRLLDLLEHVNVATIDPDNREASMVLSHLAEKVCSDLDTLLLVKQVWEQALIYARFGAKARG